jgi:hypothetical protein
MDDAGCFFGCLGALFYGLFYIVFLVFCYGVLVLVFRHAFGVELPNPFDLLPLEWQRHIPRVG